MAVGYLTFQNVRMTSNLFTKQTDSFVCNTRYILANYRAMAKGVLASQRDPVNSRRALHVLLKIDPATLEQSGTQEKRRQRVGIGDAQNEVG